MDSQQVFIPFDCVVKCFFCGWQKRFGLCFWWYEKPYMDGMGQWAGGRWHPICTCCHQARGRHPAEARIEQEVLVEN